MVVEADRRGVGIVVAAETADERTLTMESEEAYRMDHGSERGLFLIINNRLFHSDTELAERVGTDVDAEFLQKDFQRLGYVVRRYDNQCARQMVSIMKRVGDEDHSDISAVGVAFLTHGEDGVIYGYDGPVTIEQLLQPLKSCRTLIGKPKIVLIQACRGEKSDLGTKSLMTDASMPRHHKQQHLLTHLPQEADFLIAYSTVSGYVSYRWETDGSWFIHALHQVLQGLRGSEPENFADILLRVNNLVAIDYEANNGEKQMACTVSTLRKRFYVQANCDGETVAEKDFRLGNTNTSPRRSISTCDESIRSQTSEQDVYNVLRSFHLVNAQLTNTSGAGARTELSWQQLGLSPQSLGRCSAVYRRCDYRAPDGRSFPVFVAEATGPPPVAFRTTGHEGRLHMGVAKPTERPSGDCPPPPPPPSDVLFFVVHPNAWNPYQHRFIADARTKTVHEETEKLIGNNFLVQYLTKSWIGKPLLYLG